MMLQYKKDFIDILNYLITKNNLQYIYNLNNTCNINTIVDIIISISIVNNTKYMLPKELIDFFNISKKICSKSYIKLLINTMLISDNNLNFLNNFLIIGNDIPNNITNLEIII